MELDAALALGMSVDGSDNDWSTKCDRFSNPAQVETDGSCDVIPPRAEWRNDVEGGTGMMAGLLLGYRRGRLRIEGEYFYRTATYGGVVPTAIGGEITLDKADQELEEAEGRGFFVVYRANTSGLSSLGAGLSMKYRLG